MTIYFEEWQETECGCSKCDWKGTAGTATRGRMHRGLYLDLYCPECTEFIDLIIFPEEGTCAHRKEELTDEQLEALKQAEEVELDYERQCLASSDQLPDLPGQDLSLAWDQEQGETLIRCGDIVIWREPVAYEAFERFERIALILREKYGARIKDLAPTDRSLMFLYGDYYPSMFHVAKVRKELFGATTIP